MTEKGPFFAKKSLGQHFLINPRIVERMIASCDLSPEDSVLEIGPGKGALTHALSKRVKKLTAVEKDGRLAEELNEVLGNTPVAIVHADILDYPFEKLPGNTKIIGNLPYNIATPVIEKVLKYRQKFMSFYMTVQLEYGQRLAAEAGSKRYGALSCFVQYYADAKMLFKIKGSSFKPVPKVASCFLRLDILKKPKYRAVDEKGLFRIIRTGFNQRRKTIENALCAIMKKQTVREMLDLAKIGPKKRAEQLKLEEFVKLANTISEEEKRGRTIYKIQNSNATKSLPDRQAGKTNPKSRIQKRI